MGLRDDADQARKAVDERRALNEHREHEQFMDSAMDRVKKLLFTENSDYTIARSPEIKNAFLVDGITILAEQDDSEYSSHWVRLYSECPNCKRREAVYDLASLSRALELLDTHECKPARWDTPKLSTRAILAGSPQDRLLQALEDIVSQNMGREGLI